MIGSMLKALPGAALLALLASCATAPGPGTSSPAPLGSGIAKANFDPAVRAQDDLYRHVNGHWLATTGFPPDRAYIGSGEEITERTRAELRAIVEAPRPSGAAGAADADAIKIADLYASFMDEAAIERAGSAPLAAELGAIDAVADKAQLARLFARLGRLGVNVPIGVAIGQDDRESTRYAPFLSQGGLGLPSRDYYLVIDDPKFREARERYVDYLARLLALADPRAAAPATRTTAAAILALETEMARVQWTPVELRDPIKGYNKLALAALPTLAPGIAWSDYLASAGLAGRTPDVIVRQPSYLSGLGALLQSTDLATWKAYARAQLLQAYAPYLAQAYVDARFDFVGKTLAGTPQNRPRWQRGLALVDRAIGDGMGRLYVARYFPPSSKARVDALVANLLAAYRESLETNDWMGPETRRAALAKLAKFNAKIGYPKRWLDYSKLELRRDDLIGNVMRANDFDDARQLAKLGRPIDRDEWFMNPQTVNAYYDGSMNEIVFPAAFMQAPGFDPAADDAVNYGAIGAIIGHEISHGFDDEGSQYDGDGNLHDWWTAADRAAFSAKTQALVAQYAAFVAVAPNYHVDGALTLGENIADNAGLAIAYKAYRRSLNGKAAPAIDGMSGDERFFYGYAQLWRGKVRDEALLAQIKSDPHAPNEFRVIGAARNQSAFQSAFKVQPGDRMYLAPQDRVSIW